MAAGGVDGTADYSRYGSAVNRAGNRRYHRCYPVPPRRSLGAQGARGRGNQDSTRDPLYCRGCCNRQRRRGDLEQPIFILRLTEGKRFFPFRSIVFSNGYVLLIKKARVEIIRARKIYTCIYIYTCGACIAKLSRQIPLLSRRKTCSC